MPATRRARSRRTSTVRYAFDEANRLLIRDPAEVLSPVRTIEGRITADANNRLVYRASQASGARRGDDAYAFDGAWRLTPEHGLAFAVHRSGRQARQTLYLKGALVRAESDALVVSLRQTGEDAAAEELSLSGRWAADAANRLTFLVARGRGREDRLTLRGGWTLGDSQEVFYQYRQEQLRRRVRTIRTIRFAGRWEIPGRNQLAYRLDAEGRSGFLFRASLERPTLPAQEGRIAYQIGVGLAGASSSVRRVELFGAWTLRRDLTVSFEMAEAGGRRRTLQFGGTYALTRRNDIAVALRSAQGRPLGLTVTFTRRMSRDAAWFLRLQQSGRDVDALAGATVRF